MLCYLLQVRLIEAGGCYLEGEVDRFFVLAGWNMSIISYRSLGGSARADWTEAATLPATLGATKI